MIKDNIIKVRQRIALACARIDQDPGRITLIAVTKGRTVGDIEEAVREGITDIGENRVQEAAFKYNELRQPQAGPPPAEAFKWHMIGHLQTNKVKEAVKIFDLIQSVDSQRLAQEIDKQAAKINKVQDILLEIKTSPEESKSGLKSGDVEEAIKEAGKLKNINIKGLMTIAPAVDNPEKARPYFRMLRQLRDKTNKPFILSMGMTDDFEAAIEEGATMVRIGRAIFEG
jgi:PLP dependent protein